MDGSRTTHMYRTYGSRTTHVYRTYGIRAMHMYRTYGIRAMQELLPRSSTPVDSTDLFRIMMHTERGR